uniref:Syndecan n=1 Tax=Amphilophus citrinellus TaxID=61819 RepID=A0A3Q0RV79_AMPCI
TQYLVANPLLAITASTVIACGVVGFLCAVFLLALLAYRMKKKDEGSYELGDNKLSVTAYHKAPTKEFYA